jgi:hypothetical protein
VEELDDDRSPASIAGNMGVPPRTHFLCLGVLAHEHLAHVIGVRGEKIHGFEKFKEADAFPHCRATDVASFSMAPRTQDLARFSLPRDRPALENRAKARQTAYL